VCIFVRVISDEEGNRLLSVIRRGSSVVSTRRAELVLASAQGMRAPEITRIYHCAVDHALDLIRLTGLEPDVNIPIVFKGVRPGEKFAEELVMSGERMVSTSHPQIPSCLRM